MHKRLAGWTLVLFLVAGCSQSGPSGALPTVPPASTPPAVSTPPPAVAAQQQPPAVPTAGAPAVPATGESAAPVAGAPAANPVSVQDLIAQAQQAVGPRPSQSSDFAGAVKLLEQAFAADAKNVTVLGLLAQFTQYNGMVLTQQGNNDAGYEAFLKSGEYFRKLRQTGQPLDESMERMAQQVYYNEACAFARQQKTDKAVASLGEAFDAGWSDLDHVDKDADFNQIRETPEFKALRDQAPARLLAAAREHVKKQLAAHEPFDFNFSLPDLDGKTVSLADFKGKVLIVDVWGTWCPPCRMEIPHFVELHKKYREAGLEIVGINYENGPRDKWVELIKSFAQQNSVTYSCVLGDDATQQLIPDFGGFPTTLFVDRSGKVRLKVVGYHPLASLEAIVEALLKDGAAAPVAN